MDLFIGLIFSVSFEVLNLLHFPGILLPVSDSFRDAYIGKKYYQAGLFKLLYIILYFQDRRPA